MESKFLISLFCLLLAANACVYVSPSAPIGGNGSITKPFSNIQIAVNSSSSVNVSLCLMDGFYNGSSNSVIMQNFNSIEIVGSGSGAVLNEILFFQNVTSLSITNLVSSKHLSVVRCDIATLTNMTFRSMLFFGCCKGGVCKNTLTHLNCSNTECSMIFQTCPTADIVIQDLQIMNATSQYLTQFIIPSGTIQLQNLYFKDNKATFGVDCVACPTVSISNSFFVRNQISQNFPFLYFSGNAAYFDSVVFFENDADHYLIGADSDPAKIPNIYLHVVEFSCNSINRTTQVSPVDPAIPDSKLSVDIVDVNPVCPFAPCSDGKYTTNVLNICRSCPNGQVASGPVSQGCTLCPIGRAPKDYECAVDSAFLAVAIVVPVVIVLLIIVIVVILVVRKRRQQYRPEAAHLLSK